MKADIVIFSEAEVATAATFENPKVFPEGIQYVLVNGKIVINDYKHTGTLPGVALRSH
jgi:N-acyl-D-amino-acid deacylase